MDFPLSPDVLATWNLLVIHWKLSMKWGSHLASSYLTFLTKSSNRYTNWGRLLDASDSDNGAPFSTKTYESIRRFHCVSAMTATKVAHVISATVFRPVKLSGPCVCFVKRPTGSTCRHSLWGIEVPPSEVKVGHRGGIRGVFRFKLEDRELKSIDFLVRKFAVAVETVW